jgi:hypothetical protein
MIPRLFSLTYICQESVFSRTWLRCIVSFMMVAARTLYVVSLLRIRFYVHANISSSAFSTSIWHVRILPVKRDRIQDVSRTCHSHQPEGPCKHARPTKSGRDTGEDDHGAVAAPIRLAGSVAPGKPCESFLLNGLLLMLSMPLPATRKGHTMVDSAEFFCFWTSFMMAGQVHENDPAKMP